MCYSSIDDHKLYYFGGVQKYNVPQEVPELNGKRIKQICSDGHILVLTEEGDIYGWGKCFIHVCLLLKDPNTEDNAALV